MEYTTTEPTQPDTKQYAIEQPDGNVLRFTAPADASETDLLDFAQQNYEQRKREGNKVSPGNVLKWAVQAPLALATGDYAGSPTRFGIAGAKGILAPAMEAAAGVGNKIAGTDKYDPAATRAQWDNLFDSAGNTFLTSFGEKTQEIKQDLTPQIEKDAGQVVDSIYRGGRSFMDTLSDDPDTQAILGGTAEAGINAALQYMGAKIPKKLAIPGTVRGMAGTPHRAVGEALGLLTPEQQRNLWLPMMGAGGAGAAMYYYSGEDPWKTAAATLGTLALTGVPSAAKTSLKNSRNAAQGARVIGGVLDDFKITEKVAPENLKAVVINAYRTGMDKLTSNMKPFQYDRMVPVLDREIATLAADGKGPAAFASIRDAFRGEITPQQLADLRQSLTAMSQRSTEHGKAAARVRQALDDQIFASQGELGREFIDLQNKYRGYKNVQKSIVTDPKTGTWRLDTEKYSKRIGDLVKDNRLPFPVRSERDIMSWRFDKHLPHRVREVPQQSFPPDVAVPPQQSVPVEPPKPAPTKGKTNPPKIKIWKPQ